MKKGLGIFAFVLFAVASAYSQTPAGAIIGAVTDPSGAAVSQARVDISDLRTGYRRTVHTSALGDYSALALPPGTYEVAVHSPGFQRLNRTAVVETGVTTTLNLSLALPDVEQVVEVSAVTPQLRYDAFDLSGVVTGAQVEQVPLNGRNFLELAKLEPGAQQPAPGTNNRVFVPLLGAPNAGNAGARTRVTADGGSIMAVGSGGAGMSLSQEVVQEFQVSTLNLDLSTGMTASGAVSVVTRSGSNTFHGSGFVFLRDHHLAAYPGLIRDPSASDPFFQRRQFGLAAGGPIRRDTAFFFASFERSRQRGVVATTLQTPDFAALSTITPSPADVNLATVRLDYRWHDHTAVFLRYSHQDANTFTTTTLRRTGVGTPLVGDLINSTRALPSAWTRQPAWADQVILGLTSQLRPHLVNDLRVSWFFTSSAEDTPTTAVCGGCLGLGSPAINVSPDLFLGTARTTRQMGRRFHLSNAVAWQRGTHRFRFGGDAELTRGSFADMADEPATVTLYSPQQVRAYNNLLSTPLSAQVPLPPSFSTLSDILQLPVHSFAIGIGDPRVPQAGFSHARAAWLVHLFFQDAWQARSRLTLKYGLAWNYDTDGNYDLRRPAYLAPLLGADGLGPTRRNWANLSPSAGFAFSPGRSGRTVIRGGAGLYYDVRPGSDAERVSLGPLGTGRGTYRSSGIPSPVSVGGVPFGVLLNILARNPSHFTGAVLMQVLPTIRTSLQAQRGDPQNRDFSVTNIEADKQGALTASSLPDTSALTFSAGLQRELGRGFVVSADFVFRRVTHFSTGGGGFDFNHFQAARGPVLPLCVGAQRNDPTTLCSLGPIQVFSPIGRGRYHGLLVRADRRFSSRLQFLGSYAWTSNVGTNFGSGFNNDDRQASHGPLDRDVRHILNLSGVAGLPLGLRLGFVVIYNSKPPFSAFLGSAQTGFDLNGDGTGGDLLPGTTANQFNRSLGKEDLRGLVAAFNQEYAGQTAPLGGVLPKLTLPPAFEFGDSFLTHDVRLSRDLRLRERWTLTLIGEAFNLFNIANLSGFNGDLTNPATFGQPASRVSQVFGSGGPRSFQIAARVTF